MPPLYQELTEIPPFERAIFENGRCLNLTGNSLLWSGKHEPPAIGARIHIKVDKFGSATVIGYFSERNWFGLLVNLDKQPDWHIKQKGHNKPRIHVFGAEFEPLDS
jgi:hypothetical protein